MTVGEALAMGQAQLAQAGIDGAGKDARLLMGAALGIAPDRVILAMGDDLDDIPEASFFAMVQDRAGRKPLSHILGHRDFWRYRFEVSPDVLDPRPETELLVELALAEPFAQVLDLGTGSGCILLSLLGERPDAVGFGTDISPAALAVAGRNAQALGLGSRTRLEHSDWFDAVGGSFDLIVSNPPYIAENDYASLAPELRHEPRIALTPGGDGLAAYRRIAGAAPNHLTPGGRLMVEIGRDQGSDVSGIFRAAGLEDIRVHPDINGKDRVVSARARRV